MSRAFQRPNAKTLARRLAEPRRFIQAVAGARQVGKTTLVQQVCDCSNLPVHFASADEVMNSALMSAQSDVSFDDARADRQIWGRFVESAVGAHLANAAAIGEVELFYWRQGSAEVDFVLRSKRKIAAIEVKSGAGASAAGMTAFSKAHGAARKVLVGPEGVPVDDFLARPATDWI